MNANSRLRAHAGRDKMTEGKEKKQKENKKTALKKYSNFPNRYLMKNMHEFVSHIS